ncbi:hypothetical protein HDU83_005875 [Entophlyctis luteolus]|nr:hypothetical protein HDU83_005875 [Entophlyctis luteolus]
MWAVGTAWNVSERVLGGYQTRAVDRGYSDFVYKGMVFVFSVAVCFAFLGYYGTKSLSKKSMTTVFMVLNFVVAASWGVIYLRAGVTLLDLNGNPIDIQRYLEWAHDEALEIYFISLLTSAEGYPVIRGIIMSHACMLTGYWAAIARAPYDELFATVSMATYFVMVQDVLAMFQRAIDGEVDNRVDLWTLRKTRDNFILQASYITFAWYMCRFGYWSFALSEAHIAFGEFLSKSGMMLLFVNYSVEESQVENVVEMESFTTSLDEQMAASDKLLEKMIPAGVLDQLKSGKATGAEEYSCVTVFFSDIANFTPLSQRTSTKDMLASLNNMWIEYDKISKKYGMYKVETIGDAFLGVVGAPDRVPDHAERAADFALDIIEMIKSFRLVTGEPIQIRAGLNSGPVTAGILGESNPHWCIVGDTVTIASKMEATSKHMKIHIAESTYNLLKASGRFAVSPGEPINLKGTVINSYFVEGRA